MYYIKFQFDNCKSQIGNINPANFQNDEGKKINAIFYLNGILNNVIISEDDTMENLFKKYILKAISLKEILDKYVFISNGKKIIVK